MQDERYLYTYPKHPPPLLHDVAPQHHVKVGGGGVLVNTD